MVVVQIRSKRKPSGARYKCKVNKRLSQKGNNPTNTRVGKAVKRTGRVLGGNEKSKQLYSDKINVFDSKNNSYSVADITSVLENSANRHFIRRNIMTKGCIINTSKGKVKITSRPGQEGVISGVLVE